MVAFSDIKDEFLNWLLAISWSRIFANGCAAFFTVLAGTTIAGIGETSGFQAAVIGAAIQAGLAASQEFKAQASPNETKPTIKTTAYLLF